MSESKIMEAVVIIPEAKQELISIATENGLAENTRDHIIESFVAFYSKMKELKEKALSIEVTNIEQKDEMKKARELRIEIKNIRTSANKVREQLKEDSLRYGKTVQSIFNAIEAETRPAEQHLEKQEKFVELQEAKQKAELKERRLSELQLCETGNLLEFVPVTLDLSSLSNDDFLKLFNGAKLQLQARIDAERKAEEDRIAKEKAEAEERERIKLENERLRKEAEEREKALAIEREAARKEAEKKEKELAAERAKAEAEKRRLEEAERKRIADEQGKKAVEEKARKEAESKAAAAPDVEKLKALAEQLESLVYPSCTTEAAQDVVMWAKSQLSVLALSVRTKLLNV